MIKTPVRKGIWNGQWPILDVRGMVRLYVRQEEDAEQIVAALNAQPKCKTCGDSKWVDVDGQSGAEMEALGNPPLERIPCPSCQQPSGVLVKELRNIIERYEVGLKDESGLLVLAKLAAARISALEKKQKTSTVHLIAAQDLLDGPVEKLSQCDCRHCNNTYCPILALVQGAKNALTKEAALGEKGQE